MIRLSFGVDLELKINFVFVFVTDIFHLQIINQKEDFFLIFDIFLSVFIGRKTVVRAVCISTSLNKIQIFKISHAAVAVANDVLSMFLISVCIYAN